MALVAALGVLAAFLLVGYLVYRNPKAAERWYGRYKAVQTIVWGTFFGIVGLVLLGSGQPLLMLTGFFIWTAIIAALIIDGPLWGMVGE